MDIKMESHPYYAQWRVMSEWCAENAVGILGDITLENAIDCYKAGVTQEKEDTKPSCPP